MSSELSMEGLEAHRDYIAGAMRERTNSAAAESLGILHSMAESWRAHVEAGRVSVPREPTDEMLYMMYRAFATKAEKIDSYTQMLSAAHAQDVPTDAGGRQE